MNENDLREAMRTTMTLSPEPPPMDSATAVTAGRRAVRRRTTLAGAGATAVLVAAVLAIAPGQRLFAGGGVAPPATAGQAGAQPSPTAPAPGEKTDPSPMPLAPGEKTGPSWPLDGNGKPQQDATARSGTRYEQGKLVLDGLLAVVPDGYTTPTGEAADGVALQYHQAAVEDSSWGYLASAAIAKDEGTGRLVAEVHTKGNKPAST